MQPTILASLEDIESEFSRARRKNVRGGDALVVLEIRWDYAERYNVWQHDISTMQKLGR